MGIVKHKCATFAEAEMLALGGARDVFLAYNVVGPNVGRAVRYRQRFPRGALLRRRRPPRARRCAERHNGSRRGTRQRLRRHRHRAQAHGASARARGARPVREDRRFEPSDSGRAARVRRAEPSERPRRSATRRGPGLGTRSARSASGSRTRRWRSPRSAAAAPTPFPCMRQGRPGAGAEPRNLRLPRRPLHTGVPGHGVRGGGARPHAGREPPLARSRHLRSRPQGLCGGPPAGRRLHFPAIPDAKEVPQNEEHLVIETECASLYRPGDVELAIPAHICPTSALHSHAWVVSGSRARERWEVTARDRTLTL